MAENGGGNGFLGFILGGLVVAVAMLGFLMYGGADGNTSTAKLEIPKAQTR
jgi:hypothetical protein